MRKVLDKLFISGADNTIPAVRAGHISSVLCVMHGTDDLAHSHNHGEFSQLKAECDTRGVAFHHIPIDDDASFNLIQHIPTCNNIIAHARANTSQGIVVCCKLGVSRSAAIVTAYIMTTERISWDSAVVRLRAAVPISNPNPGFQKQLELWELMGYELKGDDAAHRCYDLYAAQASKDGTFFVVNRDLQLLREGRWHASTHVTSSEELEREIIDDTGFGMRVKNMLAALSSWLVPGLYPDENGPQVQTQNGPHIYHIPTAGNSHKDQRSYHNNDGEEHPHQAHHRGMFGGRHSQQQDVSSDPSQYGNYHAPGSSTSHSTALKKM
eukprot:PhM_4_TR15047/c0_g1_i1/m.103359/K14819/DUSP12, YVH1; dual specificity phosphatase 12